MPVVAEFRAAKTQHRIAAQEVERRTECRRQLEAGRATRLRILREHPVPGQRDCPECGCSSRSEIDRRYLSVLDSHLITYRCEKCDQVYDEMELAGVEAEHFHDCTECGVGYTCNMPGCRDGNYSNGHGCTEV